MVKPKKLMNNPSDIVSESIKGLVRVYPDYFHQDESYQVLYHPNNDEKVSLVSGGGSGHEPMLSGLIGENMLTSVALGNVFTSPDPQTILAAIKHASTNKGVLNLVWNYAGDRMNFEMASELAAMEAIQTEMVIINDDIASAPKEKRAERRGIAGMLFVAKIAGAASSLGYDLQTVRDLAQAAADDTRSVGIALTPCSIPGKPANFMIKENEYEYGMGIHGEPGIEVRSFESANEIVIQMLDDIFADFDTLGLQEEVVVLVNGMAATTSLELYLVANEVGEYLATHSIRVHDLVVGKYCTAMEMAGISITVMRMSEHRKSLYDIPALTPFYSRYR